MAYRLSNSARWLFAMCVAVGLCGASAAKAQDFKIGGVGSLTGPASPFTRDVLEGFNAYLKSWNEAGGYRGRKVVLDALDDETNPVAGVTSFRRIATDPAINAIFVFGSSQTALAIKQVADEFKVPVVGTGTVDELAVPPARYFFRGLPGTNAYMGEVLDFAKRKDFKTIAILNPTDAGGQREAAIIKDMSGKLGLRLVAAEAYAPGDTNFTAQLVKIRDARPDFVYVGAFGAPAVLVFKQIKQLQLSMPLAMHSAAFGRNFFTAIGGAQAADGIYAPVERGALADQADGKAAEHYAALNKALGKTGNQFHTAGWDIAVLLADAIKRSDGSRESIRMALEEQKTCR